MTNLKMADQITSKEQDMKKLDLKMIDQVTRHKNSGLENNGPAKRIGGSRSNLARYSTPQIHPLMPN